MVFAHFKQVELREPIIIKGVNLAHKYHVKIFLKYVK